MAEKALVKKDMEELFVGFEKRQDGKLKTLEDRVVQRQDQQLKAFEDRVVHQFHIVSEGLVDQIKLLAEGHAGIVNRLDRLEKKFDAHESENERQHLETRALVKLSFSELDRRLSSLESQVKDLQEWRKQVESRLQVI